MMQSIAMAIFILIKKISFKIIKPLFLKLKERWTWCQIDRISAHKMSTFGNRLDNRTDRMLNPTSSRISDMNKPT